MTPIKAYDIVRLNQAIPGFGLREGMTGTVLFAMEPGIFEVEFLEFEGETFPISDQHLRLVSADKPGNKKSRTVPNRSIAAHPKDA